MKVPTWLLNVSTIAGALATHLPFANVEQTTGVGVEDGLGDGFEGVLGVTAAGEVGDNVVAVGVLTVFVSAGPEPQALKNTTKIINFFITFSLNQLYNNSY